MIRKPPGIGVLKSRSDIWEIVKQFLLWINWYLSLNVEDLYSKAARSMVASTAVMIMDRWGLK